ncbi:hypothetical protein [Trichothermofontia sp.]
MLLGWAVGYESRRAGSCAEYLTHWLGLQAPAADAEAIAPCLERDGEFRVWRLPGAVQYETPAIGQRPTTSLVVW